jgi:hypothetical protein
MEVRSCYHCYLGKTIITCIIHTECVSIALGIQCAVRMIIMSLMACPTLLHFFTISHKLQDFIKKEFTVHKMRVLIFSTTVV